MSTIYKDRIDEYLELTKQIRLLMAKRKSLGETLPEGRHLGLENDVVVGEAYNSTYDMIEIRKYVTPEVLDRCRSRKLIRRVAVVPKLKEKKPKAGGDSFSQWKQGDDIVDPWKAGF